MSRVLWFHQHWFYVATAVTGLVGAWGLGFAVAGRDPDRAFLAARRAAVGAMLAQVAAGVVLYAGERRPENGFHVFYGVVIAVTLALAYVYRSTMDRRPALWYGLLLLFVMGLGLRAWANVN